MASLLTRSHLKRLLFLPQSLPAAAVLASRNYSLSAEPPSQKLERIADELLSLNKLERIADELLSLNKLERYDYSILFRLRLGLNNSAPALSALDTSAGGQQAAAGPGADAKAEKMVFEVKLEKFDAAAKIKVIKEVRGFTELGLKEAKDLVEKAPVVVKMGVSKEEGEAIIEKLKALGATVVLE